MSYASYTMHEIFKQLLQNYSRYVDMKIEFLTLYEIVDSTY